MYRIRLSTPTKKQKIIIDTNVIVSASVLVNVEELGLPVRHRFYNESSQLFSIFKKRPSEKIGIATPTVRSEAFLVLSKSVHDTFTSNLDIRDIRTREIFFNNAVAFVNLCEHKMRGLFSVLEQPNMSGYYFRINLEKVRAMSRYIKDTLWAQGYARRYQKDEEVERRSKSIITEPAWKDDQKEEVITTHSEQVYRESKQLDKFMRKYPNRNDQNILAEAITIQYYYPNHQFYLASCDTGFFSPLRIQGGVKSDTVTREIASRFNIICDFPREIFSIVDMPDFQDNGMAVGSGGNPTS